MDVGAGVFVPSQWQPPTSNIAHRRSLFTFRAPAPKNNRRYVKPPSISPLAYCCAKLIVLSTYVARELC